MNTNTNTEKPHVVIIGAGFAGLEAAKRLANEDVRLTVIDSRNHHLFQPLLYQVATAGLSPADIAMPIRAVLSDKKDTEVLMARVEKIDISSQSIQIDQSQVMTFDFLILATGARHSYFGRDEWEPFAPGLKTLEDATEIRRRILIAFEEAERCDDPKEQDEWLTFVIVGGGPTGIELAGAIAELAKYALARDFIHINPKLAKIILVEAGPRVLKDFDAALSQKASIALQHLGVKIEVNRRVTGISATAVQIDDDSIPTRTTLWAAGVIASPLGKHLQVPVDSAGRVFVNEDLSIPDYPHVFVAGDLAATVWRKKAAPSQDPRISYVPGMAPGAMQEGRHAARNIMCLIGKQKTKPFEYVNKGSLATIGRASAVADLGFLKISGFPAWVAWLTVHIFYLIGFRNRLLVLIQWAWSYFTFQRGTRLITGTKR